MTHRSRNRHESQLSRYADLLWNTSTFWQFSKRQTVHSGGRAESTKKTWRREGDLSLFITKSMSVVRFATYTW